MYSPTNFQIKNPTLENPMADKLKVHFFEKNTKKRDLSATDKDQNLNKKELSEALYWTLNKGEAKDVRITKALSQEAISALFDEEGIIADFLFKKPAPKTKAAKHSGNKVTIPGFGTFSTRYRKARTGTHPAYNKTKGEWRVPNAADLSKKELEAKTTSLNKKFKSGEIEIAATYVVSFKAGKGLKERASAKANK
jgi:nucleoid DNA-binding protein